MIIESLSALSILISIGIYIRVCVANSKPNGGYSVLNR
jgi:hypothetical protein